MPLEWGEQGLVAAAAAAAAAGPQLLPSRQIPGAAATRGHPAGHTDRTRGSPAPSAPHPPREAVQEEGPAAAPGFRYSSCRRAPHLAPPREARGGEAVWAVTLLGPRGPAARGAASGPGPAHAPHHLPTPRGHSRRAVWTPRCSSPATAQPHSAARKGFQGCRCEVTLPAPWTGRPPTGVPRASWAAGRGRVRAGCWAEVTGQVKPRRGHRLWRSLHLTAAQPWRAGTLRGGRGQTRPGPGSQQRGPPPQGPQEARGCRTQEGPWSWATPAPLWGLAPSSAPVKEWPEQKTTGTPGRRGCSSRPLCPPPQQRAQSRTGRCGQVLQGTPGPGNNRAP